MGGKIGYILVPNSWYVYDLFYYYIVFVIFGRVFKNPKQIVCGLLGATFILIILTIVIGLGDWWWISNFAFNVGTLVPLVEQRRQIRKVYAKEYYIMLFVFCLLAMCAIPRVLDFGPLKIRKMLMILLTTILPIFLYGIFKKIKFPQNKILYFLGSISYEIYLVHGIILSLIFNTLHDIRSILCIILTYLVTFLIAWPISKISQLIK